MKLYYPKKGFTTFKESQIMFDKGIAPFEPFSVIIEKNRPNNKKLLIGYRVDGSGIFIQDKTVEWTQSSDGVESMSISRYGMLEHYELGVRPTDSLVSIFRKPKVGDTVMCVANERYLGASFGNTYEVKEVTGDGRIGFEKGAQYTYEPKYFIVVNEARNAIPGDVHTKRDDMLDAMTYAIVHSMNGNAMFMPHGDGKDGYGNGLWSHDNSKRVILSTDPYKDVFGIEEAVKNFDKGTKLLVRKRVETTPIKKKTIFPSKLIERKRVEDSDIKKREVYQAQLIERKKIK